MKGCEGIAQWFVSTMADPTTDGDRGWLRVNVAAVFEVALQFIEAPSARDCVMRSRE